MKPNWLMGALASQDEYEPAPADVWKRSDRLTERDIAPDPYMPFGVGTVQEEAVAAPKRAAPITSIIEGSIERAKIPGTLMQPSRYAPGTEEQYWDDYFKEKAANKYAFDTALNQLTSGRLVGPTPGPRDVAFGAGGTRAAKKASKDAPGEILTPEPQSGANKTGTSEEPSGLARPNIIERYFKDPLRVANPGVYKRPDVIASEAAAQVLPEHPALKELFGVTRQDLYDISQQGRRKGNVEPDLWMPGKPSKMNEAAAAVMNPANEQRILDTLSEAYKHPELVKGMVPWYVMDPAYQRMVELLGPERANIEYVRLNMHMTPFSGGSDVMTEINRGTAARMMSERGLFPQFQREAGKPPDERSEDVRELLSDVKGHLMHKNHAAAVARYLETGEHGFDKNTVKIPLYTLASGVPQTGFQTRWPVPDTHFASAVGMPEVRGAADYRSFMGGPEYRPTGPWFREKIAQPLGIEAVPGQALTWGTFAPQTGVRTGVGAGKLELLSQKIYERALELGVDPKMLRDKVLLGEEHAALEPSAIMGGLARQDEYA